ncbi:MAG: type II toxin-antitoxin system RelE/ParE family toxin [Candidatus Bipolaricaulota bacterium]
MRVQLTARALKDLATVPTRQRLRILWSLEPLAEASLHEVTGVKRLEGIGRPAIHRLRVGSYRVLCTVEPDGVTVLRVISRQDLAKAIRQLTGR